MGGENFNPFQAPIPRAQPALGPGSGRRGDYLGESTRWKRSQQMEQQYNRQNQQRQQQIQSMPMMAEIHGPP